MNKLLEKNFLNELKKTQMNLQLNNQNNYINKNETAYVLKKISKWALTENGDLKSFKEQIKDYNDKNLPSGVSLIVSNGNISLEYANIQDKPIIINQSTIAKIYNKHFNISHIIINNLDNELKNSVLAMDSITRKNVRIIVLDVNASNENPIIVTIELNKQISSIIVNEITSLYDKRKFQNFINKTIENDKNIYINEKTKYWLIRNGLQLPIRFTNDLVSTKDNNIKFSKSQFSQISKK